MLEQHLIWQSNIRFYTAVSCKFLIVSQSIDGKSYKQLKYELLIHVQHFILPLLATHLALMPNYVKYISSLPPPAIAVSFEPSSLLKKCIRFICFPFLMIDLDIFT